jgi:hypothetical protein
MSFCVVLSCRATPLARRLLAGHSTALHTVWRYELFKLLFLVTFHICLREVSCLTLSKDIGYQSASELLVLV